jgi:hypothetical protein
MKDQIISSLELDIRIRKTILQTSKEAQKNYRSQKSCLDSNLALLTNTPVGLKLPSRKFKRLIGYLILYHYYPCERSVFAYFHIDLQDHLEETEAFWLKVLQEDKVLFLKWLEEQQTITLHQFYAGICNVTNLISLLDEIKFLFEEKLKAPRRVIRRKGYRDKGSLGPEDSRALRSEEGKDFYLLLYQLELEEKEMLRSDLCQLLREHLTEGRVLTDEQMVEFHLLSRKELQNEQSERNFTAEDYCKRRSREEVIRKEKETRRAAEITWIQDFESKEHTFESRKN